MFRIEPTRPEMLAEGLTAQETEVTAQHYEYLKDLTDKGVVRLAGRTLTTDASSFGIVILEADSEETARQIMLDDPAVRQGVMNAELFPYRIATMASNQA